MNDVQTLVLHKLREVKTTLNSKARRADDLTTLTSQTRKAK